METKFEDALKKNRASLDVDEPDDDFIWSGIQAELKPQRGIRFISWKTAAIILLALMSGFVLNSVLKPGSQLIQVTLADISPEYAEQEKFYKASIADKWDQIKVDDLDRNEFTDIFNEIDHLEKLKAESLKDFAEIGANPRLVKTLFEYYEIKIRLLELMLAEIEKKKNDNFKNQTHEKYY